MISAFVYHVYFLRKAQSIFQNLSPKALVKFCVSDTFFHRGQWVKVADIFKMLDGPTRWAEKCLGPCPLPNWIGLNKMTKLGRPEECPIGQSDPDSTQRFVRPSASFTH